MCLGIKRLDYMRDAEEGIREFNKPEELIKEAEGLIKKYEKQSKNVKNSREFKQSIKK